MNDQTQELDPVTLISAYAQGVFPMAEDDGRIFWYSPDPRAILPLAGLHVSRSLRRRVAEGGYEIRVNSAFREVVQACARPGPGRESTWISPEIAGAYGRLHDLGLAHSVETWIDGDLVGGLYGVTIRGLFAGESMFSHRRDASKLALVHLVERLSRRGFSLLDVQFMTPHLARLGAIEVSRVRYLALVRRALRLDVRFA